MNSSTFSVPKSTTRPTSLRARSTSMTCSASSLGSSSNWPAASSSSCSERPRGRDPAMGREALLSERIALGRVCDGHGDLQAEDIFCLDDGVRILDCVEFSDALRHCDVGADVAFLAMDLERLGRSRGAIEFLATYKALAVDHFPDSLALHYCASRAY